MLNLKPAHSDARRNLYSFPESKILEAKEDCILGEHYHQIKTELFILLRGKCKISVDYVGQDMEIGKVYEVSPRRFHSFEMKKGSVLIGLNSMPYDGTDDYTK